VTASTAALAGSVDLNGYQITDCHFVISPAPATGATVPCAQQVGGGTDTLAVTAGAAGSRPARPTRRRSSRQRPRRRHRSARCLHDDPAAATAPGTLRPWRVRAP
jgi:hypothetical protein